MLQCSDLSVLLELGRSVSYAAAAVELYYTSSSHLSWVERLYCVTLHEEHVYEVDEDARGLSGVVGREDQPLVEYHEHQVAKEAQQEQELREKYQVQVVLLPKVPVLDFKIQKCVRLLITIPYKKNKNTSYSQVIVSAEDDPKAHVYDAKYD